MQTTIPNSNYATFVKLLTAQYEILFKLPAYSRAAFKMTPAELAAEMTHRLANDDGDKNGQGVQAVRKQLKLGNTYSAIREYLHGEPVASAAASQTLAALEAVYEWWTTTNGFEEGGEADEMPAHIFDGMRRAIAAAKGEK